MSWCVISSLLAKIINTRTCFLASRCIWLAIIKVIIGSKHVHNKTNYVNRKCFSHQNTNKIGNSTKTMSNTNLTSAIFTIRV